MSIPTTTPSTNLGAVITSGRARQVLYGAYVIALVIAGAVASYHLGIGRVLPEWLVGTQAVLTYLGIPVGSIALANTSSAPPASADTPVPVAVVAMGDQDGNVPAAAPSLPTVQ